VPDLHYGKGFNFIYKSAGSLLLPSLITEFLVNLSTPFSTHKPVLGHRRLVEVSGTRTIIYAYNQ